MKLWYQSLARETESTPYGKRLKAVLERIVDPGTHIHLQGVRGAAAIGVQYRAMAHYDMRDVITNAIQAEKEGYDAFMVGNISDYGLREAREMVNIPILGLCETSVHMASIMGANFGFVGISPKWSQMLHENVARYGLSTRMVAIEPVDTTPLQLKVAMHDDDYLKVVMAQFNAAAQKLVDKGAEVVIPAGGNLMVVFAEQGINQFGNAPIVSGIIEMVKMAETAVKLHRLTGRFTSKALSYAPPTGDYLERVHHYYGNEFYPSAKPWMKP